MGHRLFPVVGWAERGDGRADGHGNSVPRFHITWGTGPGVVAPFERRVREHVDDRPDRGSRFRHRVDELVVEGGAVVGVRGAVLEPSDGRARAAPAAASRSASSSSAAQAVIVTSGGIGGNHDLVRKAWPERLGTPPKPMVAGVPAHVDGRMLGITEEAGAHGHQPRPDVALRRGPAQLGPDLGEPRHPDPARPVVAVAGRDRQAAARAVLPGLRHPRHARGTCARPATTTRGSC